MDPKLAAFSDEITQNAKLFARIEAVYNSPEKAKLTPEQQRLVWVYWNNAVRGGAKLDAAAKTRVAAINQRLAALYAKFGQNLLADEAGWITYLGARRSRGPAGLGEGGRGRRRRGARPQGRVGDHQHPLLDGAVPDLFGPARPAREGLAELTTAAATTATRTTTRRSSPRS